MDHLVGKMAVVCDKEEPRRLSVESADCKEAHVRGEKIDDDRPFAGSHVCAEIAGGFVEYVINFFLLSPDAFSIDRNAIRLPVDESLRDLNRLAIDLDSACENQFLCGSSGGNSGGGKGFAQSFLFHRSDSIKESALLINCL